MKGLEPELYLRLLGEETLLGAEHGARPPWESPLDDAAAALVAVGAIDEQTAISVIDDYGVAASLRGEHGFAHRMRRESPTPREGRQLQPRRVVVCDREIEIAGGTLRARHAVLSGDSTRIAVDFHFQRPQTASQRRRRMHMFGGGPAGRELPEVSIRDDRGTSAGTHFSGGGSDEAWSGHLEAHPSLAADTAWIEIAGERVELGATPPPVAVRLEPLLEQAPAERHLWHELAAASHFPHGVRERLASAIDALLAVGALEDDDPLVAQARAVSALMPDHPREPPGAGPVAGLPEPWRSLLARRGRGDGPTGTIAIGAVTPIFDGHCAGLISLDSDLDSFAIEVELTPGEADRAALSSRDRLAWWAHDDRGNSYLGQMGDWSGDDESSQGRLEFWPALDPRAQRLDVMPSGQTQRAVIEVPLRWAGRDEGGGGAGDG